MVGSPQNPLIKGRQLPGPSRMASSGRSWTFRSLSQRPLTGIDHRMSFGRQLAAELLNEQTGTEQRRLLRVIVEKAAWQHGTLRTTLFEPFEILRHLNRESIRKENEIGGSGRDMEVWLPTLDTFRTYAPQMAL